MADLVFVYGTLTNDEQVAALLDSYRFVGNAACVGLRRVEGRYPTLVSGDCVEGRLLETDDRGRDRLDRYEGVDSGLYHRFSVPVVTDDEDPPTDEREPVAADTAGSVTAAVYIGAPAGLGIDHAESDWPGSDAFEERVADYLATNPVRIIS